MTQYLVTTFKDSTGRKHTHITRAKSNQRFIVVEAESNDTILSHDIQRFNRTQAYTHNSS
ncbi:DUF1381 domain-containing protein [Staphylococcus aureus]|uniref:DUF1381 domain-containing protein n=1 Tax=Staphylococcus aureus TaxID=1280 RepID=UPI00174DB11F